MEQEINEKNRQGKELEAVFSALVEAIIVIDSNLVIKEVNNAALKLFKSNIGDISGISLFQLTDNMELVEIASAAMKEKCSQRKKLVLKEQIPSEDKFENHKFTSRDLYFQITASYLEMDDHIIRIILVLHDITQIETLERIRKDFVANVSHELKTPITSILGFVETLRDGALNNKKDAREFLEIIHSQSERLDALIKDLLSLSALESFENTKIEVEPLIFSEVVSSALKVCSSKIEKRDIDVRLQYSEELSIKANSLLMEQALVNLIDNSVKYCPPKSIITIKGEPYQDYTLIRISDNGPGIPKKDIPRVFERFYTVDKARSRELGGTGLGLAIVKHIILAHKGQISLNSIEGKCVEFIIRFPS